MRVHLNQHEPVEVWHLHHLYSTSLKLWKGSGGIQRDFHCKKKRCQYATWRLNAPRKCTLHVLFHEQKQSLWHDLKAELKNWWHWNVADHILGMGWGRESYNMGWRWNNSLDRYKHLLPLLCWEPSKATKTIKATKNYHFFPKESHHGVRDYYSDGDEHQSITWYASLVGNSSSSYCTNMW